MLGVYSCTQLPFGVVVCSKEGPQEDPKHLFLSTCSPTASVTADLASVGLGIGLTIFKKHDGIQRLSSTTLIIFCCMKTQGIER